MRHRLDYARQARSKATKRLDQMLDELKGGNLYMNMTWNLKKESL
jgi:hypothetical protein